MVNSGPVGTWVASTRMADGYVPPSASLNPPDSRTFVPRELTDADLDWVNAQLRAVDLEPAQREWPTVPLRPDPRLVQIVEQ